jgi:hypothetical protein
MPRSGSRTGARAWPAACRAPTTLADLASLDLPTPCLAGGTSPAAVRAVAALLAPALARGEVLERDGLGDSGPVAQPAPVHAAIGQSLHRVGRASTGERPQGEAQEDSR